MINPLENDTIVALLGWLAIIMALCMVAMLVVLVVCMICGMSGTNKSIDDEE